MADDKTQTGTADRTRINIHESYEVQYWTDKLHVSKDELERAVAKVGPLVEDVKRELGR